MANYRREEAASLPSFQGQTSCCDGGALRRATRRERYLLSLYSLSPFSYLYLLTESDPVFHYTIITTANAKDIGWLHDRMPVVLDTDEKIDLWISGDYETQKDEILSVLKPYEGLEWYLSSTYYPFPRSSPSPSSHPSLVPRPYPSLSCSPSPPLSLPPLPLSPLTLFFLQLRSSRTGQLESKRHRRLYKEIRRLQKNWRDSGFFPGSQKGNEE